MINLAALAAVCQSKGLALQENLSAGSRKVYAVTKIGERKALVVGYLGVCKKFVDEYVPEVKRTSEWVHPGTGQIPFP